MKKAIFNLLFLIGGIFLIFYPDTLATWTGIGMVFISGDSIGKLASRNTEKNKEKLNARINAARNINSNVGRNDRKPYKNRR